MSISSEKDITNTIQKLNIEKDNTDNITNTIQKLNIEKDDTDDITNTIQKLNIEKDDTDDITEEIKKFIKEYINQESININKEINGTKNISKAFKGIGDFGEELATIINPNSLCSASKGGCSFDNIIIDSNGNIISAMEIKTCCHIQPKKCNKCNKKVPYYQKKCSFCNSNNFSKINDSRFSIDAKAHFKYINLLKQYLLIYINDINNIINISVFIIKSDNKYFNNYIKNQLSNSVKSNTCNLVPYSYDFYSSGPIKIIDLEYDLSGNLIKEYIDIFNNKSIDFNIDILTSKEKIKYELNITKKSIEYKEIENKLEIRIKKLNKVRGETNRL